MRRTRVVVDSEARDRVLFPGVDRYEVALESDIVDVHRIELVRACVPRDAAPALGPAAAFALEGRVPVKLGPARPADAAALAALVSARLAGEGVACSLDPATGLLQLSAAAPFSARLAGGAHRVLGFRSEAVLSDGGGLASASFAPDLAAAGRELLALRIGPRHGDWFCATRLPVASGLADTFALLPADGEQPDAPIAELEFPNARPRRLDRIAVHILARGGESAEGLLQGRQHTLELVVHHAGLQ